MWPDSLDSQEESDYLVFQGILPAQPRYTVELTTEGWQIKDNEIGSFLADVYRSHASASLEADCFNAGEAANL